MSTYAELVCCSNFSFLEGASHPEELVAQAATLGYQALAITDECSVAGVVRAYQAQRDYPQLSLIIGSRFRLHALDIVLLCPTQAAYQELCRIITNARRRSHKGDYQLSEWDLMSVRHGLVLWLPSGAESDHHWATWLLRYHAERLYLAVRRDLADNDHPYLAHCRMLASQYELRVTACGDVLMHHPERLALHHTLTAIRHRQPVAALGRTLLPNAERALRPLPKLHALFPPEWLAESAKIAAQCQFSLARLKYSYPKEVVPTGEPAMAYLREAVKQGAQQRFPKGVPHDVGATIEKELALIEAMDYPYYFLTIYDLVRFAQSRGILYQGRGSAANSVVCYCLGITAVDPCKVDVLFERFISKERDEPPDIDVDFEHQRREEVIQYLYQKYGRERTALAATVIRYRLKSALRDVGKALAIPASQIDFFIQNLNRRDKTQPWGQQLQQLGLDPKSTKSQQWLSLTQTLIGFPRHLSQHVGGFVIADGPLYELVPVENAAMAERTVIQWDKDDLETLHLMKVDVLALGMLTAIRRTFDLIAQTGGPRLSLAAITQQGDDPAVFARIQHADTVGVFQIESRAQMSMLPRLKPACYYDLVIQIAIVRPGPIQGDMVHPYLKRRDGEEAVSYPSKAVEQVLARTLGVPIFQEQVIKLAMVAAGFSGGEADQLRRAMAAWKKKGGLGPFRDKLIAGMTARGYRADFAEQLYRQICGFGDYGFPESHSASFAVLAYISAWLKHYYPAAFYTALLNSQPMGFYSPSQLMQDATRHQVSVLPVCVQHSGADHCLEKVGDQWGVRLGLRLVKGLSVAAIDRLLAHRPESGFASLSALQEINLDRDAYQALASSGALAALAGNRYQARWALMDQQRQLPLLAASDDAVELPHSPSQWQNVIEDYAAMGLSLTDHPIRLMAQAGTLGRFTRSVELSQCAPQSWVAVAGVVTGKQSPGTASGVIFVTLEDDTGNINVVVWAGTARAQSRAFMQAKVLKVHGIVERQGEVVHVIAGKLIDLTPTLTTLSVAAREFR
ncbi:error-prone DNA polymerase [Salinivibrio kushneri]|uniref:Error-prone DNA polymerase n=1 Tax=Salinivibrio kushneri TaxID=1908198 RepID=A0AB36JWM6_9GAMM|nr:error-prone DNA polymerase [Salinivibrio kushneri]OOE39596.1 error-prone DNA polymerase [Salinivibrio kushneri]QCP02917.1 DNA polymerase III subunit alpha [Salinivibrio kushneri]